MQHCVCVPSSGANRKRTPLIRIHCMLYFGLLQRAPSLACMGDLCSVAKIMRIQGLGVIGAFLQRILGFWDGPMLNVCGCRVWEREYCDPLGAQGKTHRPKAVSIRQPSAQAVRNARTSSELFHTRQSEQNVLWTSESKVGLPCARSVLVGLQDPSGRALPFVRCRGLTMALAEFVVSRAPFAVAPFARSSH